MHVVAVCIFHFFQILQGFRFFVFTKEEITLTVKITTNPGLVCAFKCVCQSSSVVGCPGLPRSAPAGVGVAAAPSGAGVLLLVIEPSILEKFCSETSKDRARSLPQLHPPDE